jgi:hypothetical protein
MEEQNVELQGFLCTSPGTNAEGFEDDDELIDG